MRSSVAGLAGLLLLLAACGTSGSAESSAPPASAAPVAVELPDTPVGRQLAWVLEVINAKRTLSDAELRLHFDDRLMEERNRVANVRRAFATMSIVAPLVPTELERTPNSLVARAQGNGGAVRITVTVERKSGRISGVSFLPVQ